MLRTLLPALLIGSALATSAGAQSPAPLTLESRIQLGDVRGRIDHLAVDIARQRLFVAELGNNTVGVVDLAGHRLLRTLAGFSEPQGIAYEPGTDALYVANGGDGTVRILGGAQLVQTAGLLLGSDADNVRIDAARHRVIVGYGGGALAVIDPMSRRMIASIPLRAHPESFRLTADGRYAYVNVPDAHEVAVIDMLANRQTGSWPTVPLSANFPMVLDEAARTLWVVFRGPPTLASFSTATGARLAAMPTCRDADDVFADAGRERLYVSCGEGFLDVWQKQPAGYARVARLTLPPGARTALFVPELDRLFLAVRGTGGEPPAIWVYRPD